jgi:hypothetical protein
MYFFLHVLAPRGGVAAPKILPTENSPCRPASRFIYVLKILPRISVGGISVVSVWCRSSAVVEWLVGPCRTNNRATCFFISLGVTGRCSKVCLAATDESGQRRERCKALQGNRTMPLCRDTRPDLSFLRAASVKAIVGALLSLVRCSEQIFSLCISREPACRAKST